MMVDEVKLYYSEILHAGIATIATETVVSYGPSMAMPTKLTGAVTFTNASAAVTGAGTKFSTELAPGDWIKADGRVATEFAQVLTITSDTALTLRLAYAGATSTAGGGEKTGPRQVCAVDLVALGGAGIAYARFDDRGAVLVANPDAGFALPATTPFSFIGKHRLLRLIATGAGGPTVYAIGKS
jgi:hypothetical protein